MNRGTRFDLIMSTASTLSQRPESWDMIDLMLDEFGAQPKEGLGYPARCLARVRTLSDEALLELDAYLHPDAERPHDPPPEPLPPGPWREGTYRVFVSHTMAHKGPAEGLRRWNEPIGVECFVAHSSILATRRWRDDIEAALRTCDAFVALVTEDFIRSEWCDQEAGMAFALRKLIIPIRMGADPHGFIGERQSLTGAASHSTTAEELFALLASHPDASSRMVDPILLRFARSWSWDNTRKVWPYVEALPRAAWTPERLRLVRAATRENVDVKEGVLLRPESISVPEALDRHLASLGLSLAAVD
jgi:hypothetical protein